MLIVADAITEGDRSIGDFTAVMVYMQQLFQPLSFLGSVYACVWPFFGATPAPILPAPPPSAIVQAFVDMRNLSELLAQRPDVRDAPGSSTLEEPKGGAGLEVEFRDVAFRYPKQDVSSGLRGVSFKVPSGRTLAVVGHSGAGALFAEPQASPHLTTPFLHPLPHPCQASQPSSVCCSDSTTSPTARF